MKNEEKEEINEDDVVTIVPLTSDELALSDKADADIQVKTAKAYPRNIKKAMENIMTGITLSKEAAMACNYSLPRGNKNIAGPSVHLARMMAQFWGNMRVAARTVEVDYKNGVVKSEAVAWDLESNYAVKVTVQRSIKGKDGKVFKDDMVVVTSNAGNAVALRNAVFNVIPKAYVDHCYTRAKQSITGDISDAAKLKATAVSTVKRIAETYNITEQEILFAIKRPSIDAINGDDLVTLNGIEQAVKDNDTTIELAFKEPFKKQKIKDEAEKITNNDGK